jgi:hypothetical protein
VLITALAAACIKHHTPVREALARSAAAAAPFVALLVGYLLLAKAPAFSSLYRGQISELNSKTHFNLRQFLSSIYQFYFPKLPSLRPRIGPEYGYRQVFIHTFYGAFGSLEVTYKAGVYDALQVFSAVGLVGLYTAAVVRWRRVWRSWPVVLVMLSLLLTSVVFLHYVSYRALLGNGGSDPLIVGRYLLPMVSLFGLAVAFTVGSLPHRMGAPVGAIIIAGGVLLSLTGLGITMTRFYA